MDKPDKDTYDRYCPMCEYLQAEWQCKAAEIEGTGARKTFMARQSTLDEVRRRVVELKSRDCFGATYGECGEDVLAILDSMKSTDV